MTKDWIKKPFKLNPVSQTITFQAIACPDKGKGAKVIVLTFPTQSPVRSEKIYMYDREVGYFMVEKGNNERKSASPKQVEPRAKSLDKKRKLKLRILHKCLH